MRTCITSTLAWSLLTCSLALGAPDALAMGGKARSTPAPADRFPGASIADMEENAGHLLHLGARLSFETSRGSFTFVTFPREAPRTVEQIVRLTRSGFYNGLLVHRLVSQTVVQFGNPKTRTLPASHPDVGKGGGSGKTIPPEFKGQTVRYLAGTVGLAHGADPNSGDSQMFITTNDAPYLDESYTVFGQVVTGMDVVRSLQIGDKILKAVVAKEDPALQATPTPATPPS
ncbi:MAG: peptidylprolyl isomerase [Candidatus Sericytochromatia bacterium]|nr:peptidylprolyl isomerase [Candidatus Sericytochromatia bacterium]MEB3221403.1 peptidylprolyl isomerase [Candidatus Sericytochromatia bacterium]